MALMLAMTMLTPALAAEYEIDAPDDGLFASPTSVEQVIVVGGGVTEQSNIDRSKNAALIPPPFGSPESYQAGTGAVLIPQASSTSTGTAAAGNSGSVYYPPAEADSPGSSEVTVSSSNKFTLPDGLYYSDGSLGRLKIPALDLSVKVYEDESLY